MGLRRLLRMLKRKSMQNKEEFLRTIDHLVQLAHSRFGESNLLSWVKEAQRAGEITRREERDYSRLLSYRTFSRRGLLEGYVSKGKVRMARSLTKALLFSKLKPGFEEA